MRYFYSYVLNSDLNSADTYMPKYQRMLTKDFHLYHICRWYDIMPAVSIYIHIGLIIKHPPTSMGAGHTN